MRLLRKTLASLKRTGVRKTLLKIESHIKIRRELRELNLLKGSRFVANSPYDSEYQANRDFSALQAGSNAEIKALAFYLPQYHAIPENDNWWGKGFTEWTNTKKATPKFKGHYQPREPHDDFGYYDLGSIDNFLNTMNKQAVLAGQHGIYGFCFYYYWFSGKRLLEKPIDMLLENPQIDINFCLCWANESWTRAWDGHNDEVLALQEYNRQDPARFIDDIKKYTDDHRYIRIDGKPMIVVYNPGQIPDAAAVFGGWRDRAQEIGIGEILIWICRTDNNTAGSLKLSDVVDAEIEFPPHNMWYDSLRITDLETYDSDAASSVDIFNYKKLVDLISRRVSSENRPPPLYRCAMLGWDNTARRKTGWTSYYAYSLQSFYKWLRVIINDTRERFGPDERFLFINAWNEWAEGTYLEPDKKYGYASINTFSKALYELPFDESNVVRICGDDTAARSNSHIISDKAENDIKLAIQAHIHYTDMTDELLQYISNMPLKFDCFITTDTKDKAEYIRNRLDEKCIDTIEKSQIDIYENRGRDVAPFIIQLSQYIHDYDYICHIHTKRTKGSNYGDNWRKHSLEHLLGSSDMPAHHSTSGNESPATDSKDYMGAHIKGLLNLFSNDPTLGIVFPVEYPGVYGQMEWGSNEYGCVKLLERLGINYKLPADPIFPLGNMFWARAEAIKPMFTSGFDIKDFPKDKDQIDATLAHQIERLWVYIAASRGYTYLQVETSNNTCHSERA